MRNKLSVQQAEEGDEEDGEDDLMAKDKQWGKSKRGYYGADTEEYEVGRHNCPCPFLYSLFSVLVHLVHLYCMIIKHIVTGIKGWATRCMSCQYQTQTCLWQTNSNGGL